MFYSSSSLPTRCSGRFSLGSSGSDLPISLAHVHAHTCMCFRLCQSPDKWSDNQPKVREDEFHPRRSYRHVDACKHACLTHLLLHVLARINAHLHVRMHCCTTRLHQGTLGNCARARAQT